VITAGGVRRYTFTSHLRKEATMRLVLALALTLGLSAPAFAGPGCSGNTTASTPVTTADAGTQHSPLPAPLAAPVKK